MQLDLQKPRRKSQRKPKEATEDYLETINSLIKEKGYAASVDIAERMKVSKPTVTSMVKKLDSQGFLVHERYRGLSLTTRGKKLAREMQRKHELLATFLTLFGVERRTAREDAEMIEHGLHSDTIEKLGSYTEFILSHPKELERYHSYIQKSIRQGKEQTEK